MRTSNLRPHSAAHHAVKNKLAPLLILSIITAFILVFPQASFAQRTVSCGCYCGKTTPPPCSDAKCKSVCGWKEPSSSGGVSSGSSGDPRVQGAGILGEAIHEMLFSNPQDEKRKKEEVEEAARQAKELTQQRAAEEARKRQEQYDRLSSVLKVSSPSELTPKGFDGDGGGLTLKGMDSSSSLQLKLGDPADGLRPQGTSLFGTGGGKGGAAAIDPANDPKVVDLRPQQGYSAAPAAPAHPRIAAWPRRTTATPIRPPPGRTIGLPAWPDQWRRCVPA